MPVKKLATAGLAGLLSLYLTINSGCASQSRYDRDLTSGVLMSEYDNSNKDVSDKSIEDMMNSAYKIKSQALYTPLGQPNEQPITMGAIGTGVIVKASDKFEYIITCEHVVGWDKTMFHPMFGPLELKESKNYLIKADKEYDLTVLTANKDADVAVVRTNEKLGLEAKLGMATNVKAGDYVYAVGHPFDYGKFITEGIVSNTSIDEHSFFFSPQIDPGYSGGPVYVLENGVPKLAGINQFMIRGSNGMFGAAKPKYLRQELEKAIKLESEPKV